MPDAAEPRRRRWDRSRPTSGLRTISGRIADFRSKSDHASRRSCQSGARRCGTPAEPPHYRTRPQARPAALARMRATLPMPRTLGTPPDACWRFWAVRCAPLRPRCSAGRSALGTTTPPTTRFRFVGCRVCSRAGVGHAPFREHSAPPWACRRGALGLGPVVKPAHRATPAGDHRAAGEAGTTRINQLKSLGRCANPDLPPRRAASPLCG